MPLKKLMMMKMIMIATITNHFHDLAILLLPHHFMEHEQAFAPFTCIHIARTRVQVTDLNFLLQWNSQQDFGVK